MTRAVRLIQGLISCHVLLVISSSLIKEKTATIRRAKTATSPPVHHRRRHTIVHSCDFTTISLFMKFGGRSGIDDGGQRSGEAEAQRVEATVCFALQ